MRNIVLSRVFLVVVFSTSFVWAQGSPNVGEQDATLYAQNFRSINSSRSDIDPDLEGDESLEQLMQIEYEKDAWSLPTAIGLSLIPGGGFGLVYTRKKPQAVVPFLLSTLGYGLGIAYLAGTFDESQVGICTHVRDGRVPTEECSYASVEDNPMYPERTDNKTQDPRSSNRQYWQTAADYAASTSGRNYSGRSAGISILAATYVITSTLGAVWSGMTVRAHNQQLRRDIESTADRSQTPRKRRSLDFFDPALEVNSGGSSIGFTIRF